MREHMNQVGTVILVGAGCGRDLITVKGLRAVRRADTIVYDDLIDRSLLLEAGPDCTMVYVGKRMGRHSESQERIQRILIDEARQGRTVVRLKGGDSFVFGRGGEEVLALREAGIPCQVIPGVTSAVAVPESFGIPVTHRGVAQSFTVVAGHTATDTEERYEALARLRGTLVFLMGLHDLERITGKLMQHGKPESTPASILSCGCMPGAARIDGTLGTIAALADGAATPAVLVVGPVAAYTLSGAPCRRLEHLRVAVTGTPDFTRRLGQRLEELGAAVEYCPCLRVSSLGRVPPDLSAYTWLAFTSANGVSVFFRELRRDLRQIAHLRFACIGPGTAERLGRHGFDADLVPDEYTAAALGQTLAQRLTAADRVLILRAEDGSPALTEALAKGPAVFDEIPIYRTENLSCRVPAAADYIVFASAGGVDGFFRNGGTLDRAKPVCIGGTAAARLRAYTGAAPLVAERHSIQGIIERIMEDL